MVRPKQEPLQCLARVASSATRHGPRPPQSHVHRWAITVLLQIALAGCGLFSDEKEDRKPKGKSAAPSGTQTAPADTPGTTPAGQGLPIPTPQALEPARSDAVFALSLRLAPEQVSRQLYAATGYRLGWTNPQTGRFFDVIIDVYAVTLGGVDFRSTHIRDPLTKVQTVLMVRTIAWNFSKFLIWKEMEKPDADRVFFVHTHPLADDPGTAEGRERWTRQIEEIYWRLFSRPASDDEKQALLNAFNDLTAAYPGKEPWERRFMAWAGLLYALFSAMEFWSI